MDEDALAGRLISELLADPKGFDDDGSAHDLLQCYSRDSPSKRSVLC